MTRFTWVLGLAATLSWAIGCNDDTGSTDGEGGLGSETGGSSSSSGGSTSTGGTSTATGGSGGGDDAETILEIAAGNPDLSILVEAVTKAGLVEALSGDDLTVFAPTNDAFVDLLEALGLESLDDLSAEQLDPILRYHVLGQVVDSEAAIELAGDETVVDSLGGKFVLSLDGEDLLVDAATVVTADVEAENGIVHVVDAVLLPSITDVVTTSPLLTGLRSLVVAADGGAGTPKIGEALDGASPDGAWTLFAPDNDAVDAVSDPPEGQDLTNVLLYHAVSSADAVLAADALAFEDQTVATAFSGHDLVVDGGDSVTITDETAAESTVTIADLYTENGVIHVVDGVLLPD